MKSGIILGFRVNIDFPKVGYKLYKSDIILNDIGKAQEIIRFIEENPNLYFNMKSIGYVDLEFAFYLENVNQLHQLLGNLTQKFPDAIKNYTYFSITKTHKYQWLPN